MPIGGVHLAQRCSYHFCLRMFLHYISYHAKKDAGVQLRFGRDLRSRNAQSLLQILLVAHQHIHVLDNAADGFDRALGAALNIPQLLAEIQIKRSHCSCGLGFPHHLRGQRRSTRRKRRKESAAVHPAHATCKDRLPVEIPRLQLRRGLVRPVVEDHRRAQTVPPVAVHRRHIGTGDAVVLEVLVERLHSHGADTLGNQVADGIVRHGRDDCRPQTKTV